MSDERIRLIGGLLFGPMERLTWVVLVIPDEAAMGDFEEGIGEVSKDPTEEGTLLSPGRVVH
jgi:hypothetical protein